MTDKGLEIFKTVAECGSNTEAAKILGISQPSVSRAITNLEKELGAKLINRDTMPFTLTQHGVVLLNMIDEDMGTRQRFKRYISEQTLRQIKVGSSFPVLCTYLSDEVDKLKMNEPEIKIMSYSGDNIGIRHMLALKELDVAVLPDRINSSDYHITKVINDYEWGIAVPGGVPKIDRLFIEPNDLGALPLLVPVESSSNSAVSQWLGDNDRMHRSDTYNSFETLLSLINRGYGAAFAPMAMRPYFLRHDFTFYICYPRIVTTAYVYSRSDKDRSDVLETFLTLLNDAL